ncbi:MAG: FAD-dependent oxidoreductase [Actinobacteria bacterium]|nr:FAD-dependent oxidoreductase [Actinomycetota bacterium]
MTAADPVIVIGGGIAGISCARVLAEAGVDVQVLDRGRRLGGRMAVKNIDARAVDTGASYFTVSDERFQAVVDDWAARGLARPWTDTFDVFEDGARAEPKQGSLRWGAPGGLRGLVEDLADGLAVERHTVTSVSRGSGGLLVDDRPAQAVVLAMPDPQADRLLSPDLSAEVPQLADPFEPVLALSAGWASRQWDEAFDGAFVNGDDQLAWIADDGRRRGDDASVLVAHSTPALAAEHLESPESATQPMLRRLMSLMGIAEQPEWTDQHRWSFARPTGARDVDHHLSDAGIGLCGDAWSDRPRVEAAYLSGAALASALVGQLQR